MSFDMKYIDAERLKTFVQARRDMHFNHYVKSGVGCIAEYKYDEDVELLDLIYSLQQEQLPGIEEPGVPGKDFIPVEWVDACEKYGKWKIVQQKVDLEKEIDNEWRKCHPTDEGMGLESANIVNEQFDVLARHFYELGLNARKEK